RRVEHRIASGVEAAAPAAVFRELPDAPRRGRRGSLRARAVPAERIESHRSRSRARLRHPPRNAEHREGRPAMMPRLVRSTLGFFMGSRGYRVLGLAAIYAAVFGASLCLAYALRFDFRVPMQVEADIFNVWVVALGIKLSCMFAFRQFDG